ncbi:hypothetical protein M5D96_003263 [Drosophila gunungcola]|uniref:Uncharacterized protein n=1 Tax=Drosophila gunungcola TaxID=103775 RepID=A0A9P9YRX5_9MUSC|nr:hypothetical protein M5D96_003263 [Drosophila gunungcola]
MRVRCIPPRTRCDKEKKKPKGINACSWQDWQPHPSPVGKVTPRDATEEPASSDVFHSARAIRRPPGHLKFVTATWSCFLAHRRTIC